MRVALRALYAEIPSKRLLALTYNQTTSSQQCQASFLRDLSKSLPGFSVSSKNVKVIMTPIDFYSALLSMIRHAKTRIFLSSLYIGSEENELVIVEADVLVVAFADELDAEVSSEASFRNCCWRSRVCLS